MTITFPISFPSDGGPSKASIADNNVVGVTAAPFSLSEQIQEYDGQAWELELTFPPMDQARGRQWVAAIRSLRGPVGTFLFLPPGYERKGAIDPVGVQVNLSTSTGFVLNVKTSPSQGTLADAFKAGDYISLGTGLSSHLHVVLQDAALNSAGRTSLTIWPRLRSTPAGDSAVEVAAPKGLFRLVNKGVDYDEDEAGNIMIAPTPIREAF
jgi:hypothetical protein